MTSKFPSYAQNDDGAFFRRLCASLTKTRFGDWPNSGVSRIYAKKGPAERECETSKQREFAMSKSGETQRTAAALMNDQRLRVFISYSHEDGEEVKLIANVIEKNGMEAIYDDKKGLQLGAGFRDEIIHLITHAHIFLPLLTETSLKRPWVQQEIGYPDTKNNHFMTRAAPSGQGAENARDDLSGRQSGAPWVTARRNDWPSPQPSIALVRLQDGR